MKKEKIEENKENRKEERIVDVVRILTTDIPGNKNIYTGLTKIKGISWTVSKAVCNMLKLDKNRKVSDFSKEEIKKISDFIKEIKLPDFLYNRKKDFETGKNHHLIGSDLDLVKEFDIKRLRKIRSYRGLRHATGQPTRGQKTRGHFRENKVVGVLKKAKPGKKG